MQCNYCGSNITQYPANGICPNCGANLPPDTTPTWNPHVTVVTPPPQIFQQPVILQPGINCCSRCHSTELFTVKRGFSWGLALLGCLLFPLLGLLLGFAGRNRIRCVCRNCGHRWKA